MDIFDGLESFGFTGINIQDIYKKADKPSANKSAAAKELPRAEDYLYQKSCVCPVCDNKFAETTIKKAKLRYVDSHSDLRPCYEPIDPMYYDIIMCKKCGYTAMSSLFNKITDRQCQSVETHISPKFKPREYPMVLDTDMAIERYKLALYNAMIKEARSGEKAYLCLKLAWLYRDKGDAAKETLFLQNAYNGLKDAYSSDNFPIFGLDEATVAYIVGELARRLGDYSEATKWIGNVLYRKNISSRLKDRADAARELIKESSGKTAPDRHTPGKTGKKS